MNDYGGICYMAMIAMGLAVLMVMWVTYGLMRINWKASEREHEEEFQRLTEILDNE